MKTTILSLVFFLFAQSIIFPQWQQVKMPRGKAQLSATVWDGKAYFAGGNTNDGLTNIVDIYDLETGNWSLDELSEARSFPATAANDGKLFFGGGISAFFPSFSFSNTLDIYDISKEEWKAVMLSEKKGVEAIAAGRKVFFPGGGTIFSIGPDVLSVTDSIDIYDLDDDTLFTRNLSEARNFMGVATTNNIVLFAGGLKAGIGNTSKLVDIYNLATDEWSVSELSQARSQSVAVAVGDKILIAGGHLEGINNSSNVVDIYDTTDGTWSVDSISIPRGGMKAAVIGNKAYFVGGGDMNLQGVIFTTVSSRIDIYDSETGTWSIDDLVLPRVNHAVVAVGNQLLVAGGIAELNLATPLDIMEVFTDTTSMVSSLEELNEQLNFSIFPNPSKERIFISLPQRLSAGNRQIIISDIDGKVFFTEKLENIAHGIDVSNFPKGNYVISIFDRSTGKTYSEKVIFN